jgi:hypothetical protein
MHDGRRALFVQNVDEQGLVNFPWKQFLITFIIGCARS